MRTSEDLEWTGAHRHMMAELGDRTCHELNNKLTVLIGNLGLLARQSRQSEVAELTETALEAARGCASMVARLLAFGRSPEGESAERDLATLLEDLRQPFASLIGSRGRLRMEMPATDTLPVQVDSHSLELVLTALALFSARRLTQQGTLELAAWRDERSAPAQVHLQLAITPIDAAAMRALEARDRGACPDLVLLEAFAHRHGGSAHCELNEGCAIVGLRLPVAP